MKSIICAAAAALGFLLAATPADARPRGDNWGGRALSAEYDYDSSSTVESSFGNGGETRNRRGRRGAASRSGPESFSVATGGSVGPRPRQWCGWWMRTQLGGGPAYNLAWNWRNYGSSGSPQVGAVVVWRHHVGMIVGQASNGQWIVKSGNDGGRVRERARSIAGAVVRV